MQRAAESLAAAPRPLPHKQRELTQRGEVEEEGEVTDLLNIEISRQDAAITLR